MLKKWNFITQKNLFQVLCIISLVSSTIAIIIAKFSPIIGYESSIYHSTPITFWILTIMSLFNGFILIVYQIFYKKLDQYKIWIVGLYILFLNYVIFISLYIIRGYYLWNIEGDSGLHLAYTYNILSTGHFSSLLFYPFIHIFTSQLFLLSSIDIITLNKILPLIFGILSPIFIFLFLKSILKEKNMILLSIIAGTFINLEYFNFAPYSLSNHFFPLILYIFLRATSTKDTRWELLVLIMVFSCSIFHPIPSLCFMIIICSLFLPNFIFNKITNTQIISSVKNNHFKFKLSLSLVLLISTVTWISSFYVWDQMIINIKSLLFEGSFSNLDVLVNDIDSAQLYGYSVVEQVLKQLGGTFVSLLFAIISFPIIWKNEDRNKLNLLFSLYGPLLLICLSIIFLYFLNLMFGPLRFTEYLLIICIPFIGYLLNYLIVKIQVSHTKIIKFSFIGLLVLLFVVGINGILILYPSPYLKEQNFQTTESELNCMNWLFINENPDLYITGISIIQNRFADYLSSYQPKLKNLKYSASKPDFLNVPYHFGYNNSSSLSEKINYHVYMVITEKDKQIYKDVFPEIANLRWTSNDFEKLNKDLFLYKVYSSKKCDVFYINGSNIMAQ